MSQDKKVITQQAAEVADALAPGADDALEPPPRALQALDAVDRHLLQLQVAQVPELADVDVLPGLAQVLHHLQAYRLLHEVMQELDVPEEVVPGAVADLEGALEVAVGAALVDDEGEGLVEVVQQRRRQGELARGAQHFVPALAQEPRQGDDLLDPGHVDARGHGDVTLARTAALPRNSAQSLPRIRKVASSNLDR